MIWQEFSMPAGVNNMLSDYKAGYLLNALTLNPNTAFFPWNCGDFPFASFPNGIPRASVLAAYNNKASLDAVKGASFEVIYAPGIAAEKFTQGSSGTLSQVQNAQPNGPIEVGTPSATPSGTATITGGSNVMSVGGIFSGANEPIITQQGQVS
jgi:hypothetical protein